MNKFYIEGNSLKEQIKNLVYEYMCSTYDCQPYAEGMKQAEIFRNCGLDWGSQENATSSNQQYWIVGLLRQLEKENKIVRDESTKKWNIK